MMRQLSLRVNGESGSGMTAEIQAASIGIPDTFFILMLALVVFGPRRLPEIGRQVGKLMYEFRKASNDFKYQMEEELRKTEEADRRKKLDDENRQLYPALGAPAVVDAAATDAEAKPQVVGESTGLTIQPPSTGTAVFRGKSMVQLTEEAEALAEHTRASIASRTAETPATSSETKPTKPKTAKKSTSAPKIEKEPKPAAETKAKKSTASKKAVKNG